MSDHALDTFENRISTPLIMAFMLFAGLAVRLSISWMDMSVLFQKCVVDDAFFYLGIAKNIAAGNGATFDGSVMTNGFHPVFALLLVPVFWLAPTAVELPLHLALTILSVVNVLTGFVVYLITREIVGKIGGLFACLLWLFNPYVILISLNGVEAGVAAFTVALCIFYFLRLSRPAPFASADLYTLGGLTALAVLSRIDAVFLFMSIALVLTYRSYKQSGRSLFCLVQPLIYVAATLLFLAPWFLWNLYHFGTIRQISGVTLPNIAHTMYAAEHGTYFSLQFLKTELFYLATWIKHIIQFSGGIMLFAVIAVTSLWPFRRTPAKHWADIVASMQKIGVVLMAAAMLVAFYALYFWGWLRPWYYLQVVLGMTLVLGIISGHSWKISFIVHQNPTMLAARATLTTALILLCFLFSGLKVWDSGLFPFQKQLYESAVWLKHNTDRNARIAAVSAGIYGYLTARTTDLAGVVNEEAYHAMRRKAVFSYLKTKKIDYLADREDMVRFYSNYFDRNGFLDHLIPVKRFGDTPADIVVYKIMY